MAFHILGSEDYPRPKWVRYVCVGLVAVMFLTWSICTVAIPPKWYASGVDPDASEAVASTPEPSESAPTTDAPTGAETPTEAPAPEPSEADLLAAVSAGDTAWVLMSTCLVFFMTPGLAFFYGGMVRHKNMVSTILQSYLAVAVMAVMWIFIGFSLSFGEDVGHVFGNPGTYILFRKVGAIPAPELAATIPLTTFALFQMMFAIITPALITGSLAERMRFSAFVLFMCLWHVVVYCPLAHMVWHPSGLLRQWEVLDFAGGTVVHMSSGYAALVGAIVMGGRQKSQKPTPANVPFVLLGTALLWFGWNGFNGGSSLASNALASQAVLTTNVATAAAALTWLLLDAARGRKASAIGLCTGAVAGLVCITPGSGFVTVGAALIFGILGAGTAYGAQLLLARTRIDDSLDSFPCHGAGGTMGMFLTGCFASVDVNPAGFNGLFYPHGVTVWWHTLVSIFGVVAYIMLASFLCFKVTDLIIPLRVSLQEELMGLDKSQHGEVATNEDDDAEMGHVLQLGKAKPVDSANGGNQSRVVPVIAVGEAQ